MEWTLRDFSIFLSMAIAVVGMTYTFPALGLADATVSQPPSYDADASGFNLAGEFPENPGTPSTGEITYQNGTGASLDKNEVWLEDDDMFLLATTVSSDMKVIMTRFNGTSPVPNEDFSTSSATEQQLTFEESGEEVWVVNLKVTDVETIDASNGFYNYTVEYEILERPNSDGGFASGIPLVGGVFSAGSELAATVGWGISVIWWFVTYVFEIAVSLLVMLYAVVSFVTSFLSWIVLGYTAIIAEIGGFAGLVLTLPLLLLWFETAKAILVGISLLPTT